METQASKQNAAQRNIVEWVEAVLCAFALIVLIYTFFFRVITVSGHSMDSTLSGGDKLIVSCIAYTPERGDIIVADSYTKYGAPLVKRIIAVAGDEVDIDPLTGEVSVNGTVLDEPYLCQGPNSTTLHDVKFPLIVPEGEVFVMGDNRGVSLDSRSAQVGNLDTRNILGKVVLRIFPLKEFGTV